MPCYCLICGSVAPRKASMHKFPNRNYDQWMKWAHFVHEVRPDLRAFTPGAHSSLCSAHFTDEDFHAGNQDMIRITQYNARQRRLLEGAIPSRPGTPDIPPDPPVMPLAIIKRNVLATSYKDTKTTPATTLLPRLGPGLVKKYVPATPYKGTKQQTDIWSFLQDIFTSQESQSLATKQENPSPRTEPHIEIPSPLQSTSLVKILKLASGQIKQEQIVLPESEHSVERSMHPCILGQSLKVEIQSQTDCNISLSQSSTRTQQFDSTPSSEENMFISKNSSIPTATQQGLCPSPGFTITPSSQHWESTQSHTIISPASVSAVGACTQEGASTQYQNTERTQFRSEAVQVVAKFESVGVKVEPNELQAPCDSTPMLAAKIKIELIDTLGGMDISEEWVQSLTVDPS